MSVTEPHVENLRSVALVGNYLPRKCGIATFTTDLAEALALEHSKLEVRAVVVNDDPEGYDYPSRVRFELNQRVLQDYRLAADFLNMNQVDAVCLQHEFGIFGGDDGSYVLELMRNVRMPVVTTLHTVLQQPSRHQAAVLEEIASLSDRLVVMSGKAQEILTSAYKIPAEKIETLPHGIPDLPFVDPNYYKDQFGVEGRKVILTFGLVSPGKGLEDMIGALPRVTAKHPDAVYVILGATHPQVKREHGESYRLSLQRRARELGVEEHVIFHNRFVDLKELCEFLGAADIYVTPYLNREQIVSGALAYALGAGKATISTPYWYAEEMLADCRGRLVPFRDPNALADQILSLLDHETERHAMRKRAYNFCRGMVWKEVARGYLAVLSSVRREREANGRRRFQVKTLEETPFESPQFQYDHLLRLTDDVGILQHAKLIVPDRWHGYCTDDNARALITAVMAGASLPGEEIISELACRYLSFLHHAFDESRGRFRNFLGYDRRWLEEEGSEDCQGRAIWGLGFAVGWAESDALMGVALQLFEKAVACLLDLRSPRAWAFGLVGIHAYLRRFSGDSEARRIRETLGERLLERFREHATADWPWPEPVVTYANGKIPHALLLCGQWMRSEEMTNVGLQSLEWLLRIQTDPRGHLAPIGNRGWYERWGEPARFDQQPIEAHALLEACVEAYNSTRDEKWIAHAQRCMEWFLGRNDLGAALYDYQSGGCCDGLTSDGVNLNQGAESTLACLMSILLAQSLPAVEASALLHGSA